MTEKRGNRRKAIGIVTGDKMQKTVRVEVQRMVEVPRLGKFVRRRTVLFAHDERGEAKQGDKVEIQETRPLSKRKCWRLVRILEKTHVPLALSGEDQE